MIARSDAVVHLTGKYGSGAANLLTQADVLMTDVTGGLKEPIDEALIALTGDYSLLEEPVALTDTAAYFAALDYFTLSRIVDGLSRKSDLDVGLGEGVYVKGSQLAARVQVQLERAAARCTAYGLNIGQSGLDSFVEIPAGGFRLNLDFLEPVGDETV